MNKECLLNLFGFESGSTRTFTHEMEVELKKKCLLNIFEFESDSIRTFETLIKICRNIYVLIFYIGMFMSLAETFLN